MSCSEPVGLQLNPDLKYPENLPPCPVSKEQAVAVSSSQIETEHGSNLHQQNIFSFSIVQSDFFMVQDCF